MVEYDIPSNFSILEEDESLCDCFNPETGELLLGDIMVSLEKVKEQASEYGHSEIRELGFLIAHSMLHLCGFDHVDEDERAVMEKKQEEILNNLKIYR
jgi:probable rRNA maturation factor